MSKRLLILLLALLVLVVFWFFFKDGKNDKNGLEIQALEKATAPERPVSATEVEKQQILLEQATAPAIDKTTERDRIKSVNTQLLDKLSAPLPVNK